jgi:hypothetical protein
MERRTFLVGTIALLPIPPLIRAFSNSNVTDHEYWAYPDGMAFYFSIVRDDGFFIGSPSVEDLAMMIEESQPITQESLLALAIRTNEFSTYEDMAEWHQDKISLGWYGERFPLHRLTSFSLPKFPELDIWEHNGFERT